MKAKAARDVWGEVEEGLGSVGKIRILNALISRPEECFTKYMLEKATSLKPLDIRRCLKTLVELGWVLEYQCDPKTYRINMENRTARLVAELFKRLSSPGGKSACPP